MFAFLFFWCRTEGTVRDQVTGAVFKVTKGAPHVILKLVQKANDSMISQVYVVLTITTDDIYAIKLDAMLRAASL